MFQKKTLKGLEKNPKLLEGLPRLWFPPLHPCKHTKGFFQNFRVFFYTISWDISLIYGILVLYMGYQSYVLGYQSYELGYQSYELGYQSYVLGISLKFLENFKITGHPGATMAECIVLCLGYLSYVLGYQSYVLDISLMYWILVLCIGYQS